MQHADVAMYLAKGKRTRLSRSIEPSDDAQPRGRLALAGDLRDARSTATSSCCTTSPRSTCAQAA